MNRLFNVTVFAVAFALVVGFGTFSTTMAASDNFNGDYTGHANLVGVDEAKTSWADRTDRDRSVPGFAFRSYGLGGSYAEDMQR